MLTLRVSHMVPLTTVDGPGARTSIYFGGCSIGRTNPCKGCQNSRLFPVDSGVTFSVEEVAVMALQSGLPITLIGGEPLDQAAGVAELLMLLKDAGRHVIIYSGYTWDELLERSRTDPDLSLCLVVADVLVDGRWDYTQADPFVQYRGSRNQHVIDLNATWTAPFTGPVLLDWDTPTFTVNPDGSLEASDGLIALIQEPTDMVSIAPRCGEIRG